MNRPNTLPADSVMISVLTERPVRRSALRGLFCAHDDATGFVVDDGTMGPGMGKEIHEGECCVRCGRVLSWAKPQTRRSPFWALAAENPSQIS